MKKIVGILAVAAVATSLFAADISAKVQLASTLFKTTSGDDKAADGTMEALTALNTDRVQPWATLYETAFNSDNAGAKVVFFTKDNVVNAGGYTVWFKPMDALKLSFNENGLSLYKNGDTGWGTKGNLEVSGGYGIEYTADAVTVNFNLCPTFLVKKNVEDGTNSDGTPKYKSETEIGELGAKVTYNADFGSVAVIFGAKRGWNGNSNCGDDLEKKADDRAKQVNFGAFGIGAGYSGNVAGINLLADVSFLSGYNTLEEKIDDDKKAVVPYNTIAALVSANGSVDAFGWAVTVPVKVNMYKNEIKNFKPETKVECGLYVAGTYNINGIGLKAYFDSADLLIHNTKQEASGSDMVEKKDKSWFEGTVGLDVTGSVGAASWKVAPAANINTKDKAKSTVFSVGFETAVAF